MPQPADACQLGLDVGCGDDGAIGEVTEVELHRRLKAPLERHVVDRDRRLLVAERFVHRRVKVVRRVEVGAVVGGQPHELHRPALAVGQVFALQAGKKTRDLLDRIAMGEVLDPRRERRWVAQHVVLEKDRQVDEAARHRTAPPPQAGISRFADT
jgi:hypothetical protein